MKKIVFKGDIIRWFSAYVVQSTRRLNLRTLSPLKNTLLTVRENPLNVLKNGKLFLISVSVLFFLSACSPVPPFVDARREAGQAGLVGQSTPDRVAVCYNRYATRQVDVDKVAEEECKKTGRRAVLVDETKFTCCLVAPATAFFRCEK